jgi:hypothetical protein
MRCHRTDHAADRFRALRDDRSTGSPAELRRKSPTLKALAAAGRLATPTATANQLSPSMAKWPSCAAWQAMHPPGPLLPSFVEWMMGFPDGWTDLPRGTERWETRSSRSARKRSAA